MRQLLSLLFVWALFWSYDLGAQCPASIESLVRALEAEAEAPIPLSAPSSASAWVDRVSHITQSTVYFSRLRHVEFESELKLIRYNFFRLPLSSIEIILDFLVSQLESSWGQVWMNEIRLIGLTAQHLQQNLNSKLLERAKEIEAAIQMRLPLTFHSDRTWFDHHPQYGYRTDW
jgi:hypothetical protein